MSKQVVQLAQVNFRYGDNTFLPHSAGVLQAYAQAQPELAAAFEFRPPLFLREDPKQVVADLQGVSVLGLSCYVWNSQWCQQVARLTKAAYPDCQVVMGGPQIPDKCAGFFDEHPYVDVLIHGEGELAFADLLRQRLDRDSQHLHYCIDGRRIADLSKLASPYLAGVYDPLLAAHPEFLWNATQETNRGCPYSCLTADTQIDTIEGTKPFSLLRPYDYVLGQDSDGRPVWNEVHMLMCMGIRPILRIVAGDQHVDATEDHPFFTDRGWVTAGQLCTGDRVLCRLWQANEMALARAGREGSTQGMLPSMRRDPPHSMAPSLSGEPPSPLQGVRQASINKPPRALQPDVFSRMRQRANTQEQTGRCEPYETGSQPGESLSSDEGTPPHPILKSDERPPRRREDTLLRDVPGKPGPLGRANAAKQSDAQTGGCRQDGSHHAGQVRRPGTQDAVACPTHQTHQQTGTSGPGVSGAAPTPLPLHRGQELLDWARTVGEAPQPGLHSRDHGAEASHSGAWAILAPDRLGSRGASRLLQSGMAVLPGVRQRQTRPPISPADSQVRCEWRPITSIASIGQAPVYDIDACPSHNFFANGILVSNCRFCDWGSATFSKLRQFPEDRLLGELQWFGQHKIEFLCNADANYGLLPRDLELTRATVAFNAAYGYPRRFKAAWAKNSNDRVFAMASMLHAAEMDKGVTLSLQSLNPETLRLVKRQNMETNDFEGLMARYRAAGIPTYTELILGLPGETYESFRDGLCRLLDAGCHEGINVYPCSLFVNAEMSDPDYIREHGIRSVVCPILQNHSSPGYDPTPELDRVVIGTNTMPPEDWKEAFLWSWAVQSCHSLGLLQHIARTLNDRGLMGYGAFYDSLLAHMERAAPGTALGGLYQYASGTTEMGMAGLGWGHVDKRFGNLWWPLEEYTFLTVVAGGLNHFYAEVMAWLVQSDLLDPHISVQARLLLVKEQWELVVTPGDVGGDLETFAREVVWYGRKGGKFLKRNQDAVR